MLTTSIEELETIHGRGYIATNRCLHVFEKEMSQIDQNKIIELIDNAEDDVLYSSIGEVVLNNGLIPARCIKMFIRKIIIACY